MWRFTTLMALMLFGCQAIASEQRKPRLVSTQASATTQGLTKAIVERIKRIESKKGHDLEHGPVKRPSH